MKYSVFISYRRDGGEYTAKILRDKLGELGYSVFFDVEALRSGDFNTKLYSVIDECDDFLLILSPGALDRCKSDDDWVRREIEYALERGKNVVPILLRGFKFPDILPESIENVRYKNGIEANTEFFDAFIKKLQVFLTAKPKFGKRIKAKNVIIALVCVMIVAGAFFAGKYLITNHTDKGITENVDVYPVTAEEKNFTGEVLYYTQMHVVSLDIMGKATLDAIDATEMYLSSYNRDFKVAVNDIERCRGVINTIDTSAYAPDDYFISRLEKSPYNVADFKALHDAVATFMDECLGYIDQMLYIISDEYYYSDNYKMKTVSLYRSMLQARIDVYAYCTNMLLLPITDETQLEDFFTNFLPKLSAMNISLSNWKKDYDVLNNDIESCYVRIENAFAEMSALIGYASQENAETRKDIDTMKEVLESME